MPNEERWAVRWNESASGSGSGSKLQFYVDAVDTAAPSNGYQVQVNRGSNEINLHRYNSGAQTTVAQNASVPLGSELHQFDVVFEDANPSDSNATITVYMDGVESLAAVVDTTTIDYTTEDEFGLTQWNGGTSGIAHYIGDFAVWGDDKVDSDGDGAYDYEDSYPNNTAESYLISATENKTVESAYIEATNGSFEFAVYGLNNTTNEQILLVEKQSETVGSTTLVTRAVPTGYDQYKITYHGNATLESHGLLYTANIGTSGVSEESFWAGINGVTDNQGALQAQNILLGLLIIGVALLLWFTEVTH
ncbi:hypothetical protein ACFQH6_15120 [Halobacteriaceae archaeon GCM10025711]